MSTTENKPVRKFGWKDKLAYAMGDFGCNMSFALNTTITTFYTMYIGLSTEIVAILIVLLKIWDGINDPIMGAIMDRFKPKPGGSKFMPFIFWGSIALVVSGAMVFLPIPQAPVPVKIIVCILGYLVWDTAYTVVNVPYGSLASVITTVPEERASLSLWRTVGSMLAGLPVGIILPFLMYTEKLDAAGNPIINPYTEEPIEIIVGQNVFIIALVLGVLGFIAFQILIRGTVERVKAEDVPQEEKKKEKVNYLNVIKEFGKNRAAVAMTVASFFQLVMMQGLSVAHATVFKDYFGEAQLSGVLQIVTYLPMFIAMPFVNKLVKKFGKKDAAGWPMIAGIVAGLLMFVLPMDPKNGGLIIWVVLQLFVSVASAVFMVVGWAMVADCIDYQEIKTGKREEGTVYAIYSLGRKIAQGLGAAAVLLVMGWLGFKEAGWDEVLQVEIPAVQDFDVANNIRILIGVVYFICMVVQFVMIKFVYPLDKKAIEEMNAKLGRSGEIDLTANHDD